MVQSTATLLRILLPITSLISPILTQDLSSTLVGCQDLSCPKTSSNVVDACILSNDTFNGVGLSRIPLVPSEVAGISLLKGVNVSSGPEGSDTDRQDRRFKSVYYLGTPSSLDLAVIDNACAVVFHSTAKGLQFPGTRQQTDQGTCSDVIAQGCTDKLLKRARDARSSTSNSDPCNALRETLQSGGAIDECADFSGKGRGLGTFSVTALSGLSPITAEQNASSNCWPITPSTDSLTKITEDTALAGYTTTDILDQLYKITPVLTVFYGGNTSDTIDEPTSQLTCLKVIDSETLPAGDESAASRNTYYSLSAVAISAVMLVLL